MNTIYRVIWNSTLNVWVAASELAKGKHKSQSVTKSTAVRNTRDGVLSLKMALLTVAVLGSFASGAAYADIVVTTEAQLIAALSKGTGEKILLGKDITLSAENANIDLKGQNVVVDGAGYSLSSGIAGGASSSITLSGTQSGGGKGSLTFTNFNTINSANNTTQSSLVTVLNGANVDLIYDNVGTLPNGIIGTMGVFANGGAVNTQGQLIIGNITKQVDLTYGTYHQFAVAPNIKFTGNFNLLGNGNVANYPAVFWNNSTTPTGLLSFTSSANVGISAQIITNGANAGSSQYYSYALEDGARVSLKSNGQNLFGFQNNGLQIGSYNATTGFGSGVQLTLSQQNGSAVYSTNSASAISNASSVSGSPIYNGPAAATVGVNDVVYNLAAGSQLAPAATGSGILATKTGAANASNIYISSGAAISTSLGGTGAATAGLNVSHAGSGATIVENKAGGTIYAATGINANQTGTGSLAVGNHGVINSTTAGVTVNTTAAKNVTLDNSNGTINASAGSGVNITGQTALSLNGGTINTSGTANGITIAAGNTQAQSITATSINVAGTGVAINNAANTALTLSNTQINVANNTALTSLANLNFVANANGNNQINISGTGTGISAANTNLAGKDFADLAINVNGAGTAVNISGGGADLSTTKLAMNLNNAAATGLVISDGASNTTTVGQNVNIQSSVAGATALSFTGTSAKTFTNNGNVGGNVRFAGSANNSIVNNQQLNGSLTTGSGNDSLTLTANSQSGDISLGDGNNTVTINAGSQFNSITTGNGSDVFNLNGLNNNGLAYFAALNAGGTNNTLNFNNATQVLASTTALNGFANINLNQSHLTLAASSNTLDNSVITLDSNSGLTLANTFSGNLLSSLSGAGNTLINKDSQVTLIKNNSAFSGAWQLNQGGVLNVSNANQLGTGNIALAGSLNLSGVAALNNALSGNGVLNVTQNNSNTAFNFGATAGNQFAGIFNLQNAAFTFNDNNAAAVSKATVQLDSGSKATVGSTDRTLKALQLEGGELTFSGAVPQTKADGVLNVTNLSLDTGTINVSGNSSWTNSAAMPAGSLSILEQNTGTIMQQLISSQNAASGSAANLSLNVNGQAIDSNNSAVSSSIKQGTNTVANAIYDYGLVSNNGAGANGLYLNYGLTELQLLGTGNDALLITTAAGNSNKTLSTKLTGTGGLQVDATNGALTISNSNNSYSGDTTVNAGTLIVGVDGALGQTASLNTAANTIVDLNGKKQTINSLANAGQVKLNGGALTLKNGGTSSTANGLNGAGTLNVAGGELIVSAANAGLSANTNIASTATLTLNSSGTLGSSAVNVAGSLNLAADNTHSNALSGKGTVNTAAKVRLTGNNSSFSGTQNIAAGGELIIGKASQLGGATVTLANASATLNFDGAKDTIANTLSGVSNATVAVSNSSDLRLSGDNSGFNGQYNLSDNSKLTVSAAKNIGSSNITIAADSALTLDSLSQPLELNNLLSGDGTVNLLSSVLNLSAGNSKASGFSGEFDIDQDSVLNLTQDTQLNTAAALNLSNTGSTLNINSTGAFTLNSKLIGSGIVHANTTGNAFDLGSNVGSAFAGTLDLGNSTFSLNSTNASALSQANLQLSTRNTSTVDTGVQNIGALTMNGGSLQFDQIVDNSGKFTSQGTITAKAIDVSAGGNLRVTLPSKTQPGLDGIPLMSLDVGVVLVALAQTGTGKAKGFGQELSLTDENGAVLTKELVVQDILNSGSSTAAAKGYFGYGVTTGNEFDGLYINYGLNEVELLAKGSDALSLASISADNSTQANSFAAEIFGDGDLAIDSTIAGSVVTLANGHNSYTGATLVRSGALRLAVDSALGQTANLQMSTNTQVDLNNTQQTVGELNSALDSTLDFKESSTLTVSHGGQVDGHLIGNGNLILTDGEFKVSQANDLFSGSAEIGGTSIVTLNASAGLGQADIHNTGSLVLNGATGVLVNKLSGNGQVQLNNQAAITLAGDNSTFGGQFAIAPASSLQANGANTLGSASIANQGSLTLNATDTAHSWNLSNTISGDTGTLVKTGAGTVLINGSHVTAANTVVEQGLLQIGTSPVAIAARNARSLQANNTDAASLNSHVDIGAQGSIAGYGQINGNVVNAGTLLPGAPTVNDAFGQMIINGDYSGQTGSQIVFNTVLAGDDSNTDHLIINGAASGQSEVIVNKIDTQASRTQQGIKLIDVAGDNHAAFTLKDRAVRGVYEYGLEQDGNAWYLRTAAEQLRPEPGSYMANMAAATTLFNLRMSDRDGKVGDGSSLWVRQLGAKTKFDSASGVLDSSTKRYVAQVGLDALALDAGQKGKATVGVMAAYGKADSTTNSANVDASSKGEVDGYSVGFYGNWQQDTTTQNGLYADSWLQYSWMDGSVSGQQLAQESYQLKGLSASLESGYRLALGNNGLSITPHAQLIWSGIKADNHVEHNGTVVESSGQGNLSSRVGVKLQKDSALAKNGVFSTSLEANWLNNSKAAGAMLDGVTSQQDGSRNIGELKLGVSGQVSEQLNLWASVAQQLGSKNYRETALTVGFKYKF
ncbi:autotransporter outer membrane beta-barrel domain-containing protein [Neisseriaceae bacterium TC5R-5]|nr:autotransporter outer membrane beta-barrel domain-containing protein [Neisseriaceae bacterium TC5R-5]